MDQAEGITKVAHSPDPATGRSQLSRRAMLGAMVAGSLGLAGVGGGVGYVAFGRRSTEPTSAELIAQVEAGRRRSGRIQNLALVAKRSEVDIGGRTVTALTYGGSLPGPEVRVSAGDLLRVNVRNELDQATSVHWHGLAVRNDADGVPGVTGPQIDAGAAGGFEFIVPDPGTYWFHSHSGLQLDWGLYAPLIVEDPSEPGRYDHELVVVLDDWSPGLGKTPEQNLAALTAGGGTMGSMDGMQGMHGMHGMDGMDDQGTSPTGSMMDSGDVEYPAYLANGRLAAVATSLKAKPGQRIRVRLINAAADTTFDVALTGHRLSVTHSDGFPITPVTVDTLRISMGERYDVTVTLGDGVFPLVAVPLGKTGPPARVLLRSATGSIPAANLIPSQIQGRRLALSDLVADISVRQREQEPDTVQDVVLGGDMASYRWTINGRPYQDTRALTVRPGELTRLRLANRTMMLHPVHLHGHTFAISNAGRARKDTVLVPAMQTVTVDVLADNPGHWMLHCHNAFHMETGMMTRLEYLT